MYDDFPKMIQCPACGREYGTFAAACPHCASPNPYPVARAIGMGQQKTKSTYVALALLLGSFGIHNFYAKETGAGVGKILLFCTLFGIPFVWIWCILDAIFVTRDGDGVPFMGYPIPTLEQLKRIKLIHNIVYGITLLIVGLIALTLFSGIYSGLSDTPSQEELHVRTKKKKKKKAKPQSEQVGSIAPAASPFGTCQLDFTGFRNPTFHLPRSLKIKALSHLSRITIFLYN